MPHRSTDRLVLLLTALLLASPAAAQDFGLGPPAAANDWLSGKRRAPVPPPAPPTGWRPGDPIPAEAARRRPAAQAAPRPGTAAAQANQRPPIRTPGHAPGDWRAQMNAAPVATSAAVPPVGVTRLSDGNPDSKGALPADRAQLPRDLWGTASATQIADRIAATQPRLDATRGLFRRILTAQLAPPGGNAAGDEGRLFLARTDRLIALGWIEDAGALLQSAGSGDGPRFARRFDVALLTNDAGSVCRQITDRPGLAPGLAARVYCLAQDGDWAAAALTLHGARASGLIPPQTVALLERFLDDSTADLTESLPDPAAVTPLEFRLFEAIGQPLATGDLPLAYAWSDLNGDTGWKARIEAAERLTRAGAAPVETLRAAYLDQRPAASGAIWDRAAAVQRLDAALRSGDSAALSQALPAAETLFSDARLLVPLARMIAPHLPAQGLSDAAAQTAAHLRLLAGLPVPDATGLPAEDVALAALAAGGAAQHGDAAGAGGEAGPAIAPGSAPSTTLGRDSALPTAPAALADNAPPPGGSAPAQPAVPAAGDMSAAAQTGPSVGGSSLDAAAASAGETSTDQGDTVASPVAATPDHGDDASQAAASQAAASQAPAEGDGASAPVAPAAARQDAVSPGVASASPLPPPSFPKGSPGALYAAALDTPPVAEAPPEGRGLALLAAMADVDAGLDGDTQRAAAGLRRMTELGFPADARRAAVELLLTEHLGGPQR